MLNIFKNKNLNSKPVGRTFENSSDKKDNGPLSTKDNSEAVTSAWNELLKPQEPEEAEKKRREYAVSAANFEEEEAARTRLLLEEMRERNRKSREYKLEQKEQTEEKEPPVANARTPRGPGAQPTEKTVEQLKVNSG